MPESSVEPGASTPAPVVTASLAEVKQRLIAQIVADGGEFRTCANCGDLYPLGSRDDEGGTWTNETVCGPRCESAYIAYLNNPGTW